MSMAAVTKKKKVIIDTDPGIGPTLDKTIGNLETKLPAARTLQESFLNGSPVSQEYKAFESSGRHKYLMIISINTAFSICKRRDSIRNTWMPQGEKRKKLEEEKGVIIRFVICHSAISGGIVDRAIATEDRKHGDFMRLVSLNLSALLTVISRSYKKVVSHTRGNCQYPRSEAFKRHLARVPDFLWISEDGMKVQARNKKLQMEFIMYQDWLKHDSLTWMRPAASYKLEPKSESTTQVPHLILFSGASALFGAYALPTFSQLTVTSYYAASSASHHAVSHITRHIEKAHLSGAADEKS
ncbi:putative beta-1,3-galactosyltransferase 2 [Hordeum vulgare]|nr:putative beta-1,3-galactosyltransferase 2 [Hordeum vulgare]